MPHECTSCGRVFDDGSKEMLSGCPDCGGNKFQFHADGTAGTDEPAPEPPDPPDPPGSTVARTVGKTAATVRDIVGGGSDPATDRGHAGTAAPTEGRPDASAATGDVGGNAPDTAVGSAEDTAQASARSEVVGPDELPSDVDADTEHRFSPEAARAAGAAEEAATGAGSTGEPDAPGPGPTDPEVTSSETTGTEVTSSETSGSGVTGHETTGSGATQTVDRVSTTDAGARTDDAGTATDDTGTRTDQADVPRDGSASESRSSDEAGADRPDLEQLRAELNDQFESIKVLSPGQYELNLMELYDREEYIVALQEDGRYSIQVPENFRD